MPIILEREKCVGDKSSESEVSNITYASIIQNIIIKAE